MKFVLVPQQFGIWREFCGTSYLLGNKIVIQYLNNRIIINFEVFKVNWTDNLAMCCHLGMEPIIFGTAEEHRCFSSISNRSSKKD